MLRKVLVVLALFLSMFLLSNPTWAQCPTPYGEYLLYGKLTAKASSRGLVASSLTLPNLRIIQTSALFDSLGGFSLFLPILSADPLLTGSWAMIPATGCPTQFVVDSQIDSLINDQLAQLGIDATVTITSNSFTGTLESDGTIQGKFNLGVSISAFVFATGTISIKGTFTGEHALASVSSTGLSLLNPPEQEGSKGSSILADLIIKFLKKISVK